MGGLLLGLNFLLFYKTLGKECLQTCLGGWICSHFLLIFSHIYKRFMTDLKGYQYRLYPTEDQKIFFEKSFGCVRFVKNYLLEYRTSQYQNHQISISNNQSIKYIKILKDTPEFSWLKEVNSQSLQQSIIDLNTAFDRFFKKISGYPIFKSKRDKQSFKIPQFFSLDLENELLTIPKLKSKIEVRLHRSFIGKIKSLTISKSKSGKYYVSFLVEEEHQPLPKSNKATGLDLGLKDLIITSDGNKIKQIKDKKLQKEIKYQHRQLSKKEKFSKSEEDKFNNKNQGKNREKERIKLALLYEYQNNIRKNQLHKISRSIINENQVIIVENLNISGMLKNHKLAKSIQEASWSELLRQLKYKAEWGDRIYFEISRWFPSSKLCNNCGTKNCDLKLSDREWICSCCNNVIDRDFNAALNIKEEGLRQLLKLEIISEKEYKEYLGLGNTVLQQKLGEALSAGSNSFKQLDLKELEVKDESMSQEAYELVS